MDADNNNYIIHNKIKIITLITKSKMHCYIQ